MGTKMIVEVRTPGRLQRVVIMLARDGGIAERCLKVV